MALLLLRGGRLCCRRGRPRVGSVGQAVSVRRTRPWASWGRSTQSTRQPRASRPPSGPKWVQLVGEEAESDSRRQPQALHVTGPLATSTCRRGQAGWGSDGLIIGRLS